MSETTRKRTGWSPRWIEDGEPGRRELNGPGPIAPEEVGIEPPTQLFIEALGPIDIFNRDHGDLELHVDPSRSRGLGRGFIARLSTPHVQLLGFGVALRTATHVRNRRLTFNFGVFASLNSHRIFVTPLRISYCSRASFLAGPVA